MTTTIRPKDDCPDIEKMRLKKQTQCTLPFLLRVFVTVLISSNWTIIYYLEMDKHSKSLLFINVQSLRSHHDQLRCQLETLETKPAVIALCET